MQLPLFFEESLPDGTGNFILSEETSKHLIQVLRMKAGQSLILTNGKGIELNVSIVNPDKKKTEVSFNNRRNLLAPDNNNGIAISLLKNESRFEWFLEKATELGIRKIYPMISVRTEKKSFRPERMRNIMISAMIQSQQYFLPELTAPMTLEAILAINEFEHKLIAHCLEEGDKAEMKNIIQRGMATIILIGPEGDFTPEEVEKCKANRFIPVSLGSTRLRTETAGIVSAVYLAQ